MYVVESEEKFQDNYFHPAFVFVGEDEPIDRFKQTVGSMLLEGLQQHAVGFDASRSLLSHLAVSNSFKREHMPVIDAIIDYGEDRLLHHRTERLVQASSDGLLTSSSLADELKSLAYYRLITSDEDVRWLNRDGFTSFYRSDGWLDIDIFDYNDVDEANDPGKTVSQELGLSDYAVQNELVRVNDYGLPALLSMREHRTFGRFDDVGEFEPVVTVLDSTHPARQ